MTGYFLSLEIFFLDGNFLKDVEMTFMGCGECKMVYLFRIAHYVYIEERRENDPLIINL